jgi:hypothetical protein
MNRWQAIMRYGLVFVLGLLAGGVGSRLYYRHHFARTLQNREGFAQQMIMRRLTTELRLSPGQQAAIQPAVTAQLKALAALRAKHQPEVQAVFDKSTADMKAHLDAGQQKELDRIIERMRHRGPHAQGRFGPPPRGEPDSPPPALP